MALDALPHKTDCSKGILYCVSLSVKSHIGHGIRHTPASYITLGDGASPW